MVFTLSVGSDGNGPERFALYLPFSLAPGRTMSPIDPSLSYEVAGYTVRLEKLVNFHALTLGPFGTESDAKEFFPKFCSSLLWVSLKETVGISYPKSLAHARLRETPTPVTENSMVADVVATVGWNAIDGDYDAHEAVVRPEAKKLLRWEMGRPSVIIGIAAGNLITRISEALAFKHPENAVCNEKLQLAIELYSAFFFEMSENAQFITLVTVLEALTPDSEIPDLANSALRAAISLIEEMRDRFKTDSGEWRHLDHLMNRAGHLKKGGTSAALRDYVNKIVFENPSLGDPDSISARLRDVQKHRGALLHTGAADKRAVREALGFLRAFVPSLLEQLYKLETSREL